MAKVTAIRSTPLTEREYEIHHAHHRPRYRGRIHGRHLQWSHRVQHQKRVKQRHLEANPGNGQRCAAQPYHSYISQLGERGVEIENRKDTTYYVKGYVDSMNGMGVPVRTRFEMVIKCEGANKWKMVSWDTEDAKVIRQVTDQITNSLKQIDEQTNKGLADAEQAQREAEAEAANAQRLLEAQQQQAQPQPAPVEQPAQPQPSSSWGSGQ